jgi:hypothetical protein
MDKKKHTKVKPGGKIRMSREGITILEEIRASERRSLETRFSNLSEVVERTATEKGIERGLALRFLASGYLADLTEGRASRAIPARVFDEDFAQQREHKLT